MMRKCNVCNRKVLNHSHHIKCSGCKCVYPIKCLHLVDTTSSIYINRHLNDWICTVCLSDNIPFINIFDDDEYHNTVVDEFSVSDHTFITDKLFNPFDLDINRHSPLFDIDPDINFLHDGQNHDTCHYYHENSFNHITHNHRDHSNTDSFSILHVNLRSIPKNFDSFLNYLHTLTFSFTIIAVTETWLSTNNSDNYGIPGYNLVSICRDGKRGGGVCIFIKESLSYNIRTDLNVMSADAEMLFIELDKSSVNTNNSIIVGLVYRPPNTDVDQFNDKLQDTLSKINRNNNQTLYIMGDFNLDLLKHDAHTPTDTFLDTMYTNSLLPNITKPTRVTRKTATLIDNIFSNTPKDDRSTSSGILVTDISDHYPIFYINSKITTNHSQACPRRDYSQSNIDIFLGKLQDVDWSIVSNNTSAKDSFTHFYNTFTTLYNSSFPYVSHKSRYHNRKPWLTAAVKNSIARKNWLYKLSIKEPCFEGLYKEYKNRLTNLLRKLEKDYYEELLRVNKSNIKKSWTIIKEVINKRKNTKLQTEFKVGDQYTSDPTTIVNNFNSFFSNIGPQLSSKLPNTNINPCDYIQFNPTSHFSLSPVTEVEIATIIHNLKISSPRPDDITPKIIKSSSLLIKAQLTHILNLSFQQGYFPDELKLARVAPIFKSGDPKLVSNYRPVSVLNSFSKIFERAFANQLLHFVAEQGALYDYQFGFRKAHSTNLALTIITDKISEALDAGDHMVGVFLDFSKAFDTINHNILLQKLERYGIVDAPHNWITSYLTNRSQYVNYNQTNSNYLSITCGVPQGSILGPLFLFYINDMIHTSKKLFYILFADDSNAFFSGKRLEDIFTTINQELSTLTNWLLANRLTINIKKLIISFLPQQK